MFNISKELIIKPHKNGVLLHTPKQEITDAVSCHMNTVNNILNLPMNTYFMDYNSIIIAANETTAETCGFSSLKSAIGAKITCAAKKESAEFSIRHDKTVMSIEHVKITEENFIRRIDDIPMQFISIKLPWYENELSENIHGIFGFTISPSKHGLAKSLALIAKSGLAKMNNLERLYTQLLGNTFLSRQESHCLMLLAKGYSTRCMAKILKLSVRTIEHYLEHAKIKLNLSSKQELVEKALEHYVN